jgi:hypothetical protein
MATSEEQAILRELEVEREKLAEAVVTFRDELGEATDVSGKLRANLPGAAAAALALGFLVGGGIGATARLVFRRGREGDEAIQAGRFSLIRKR